MIELYAVLAAIAVLMELGCLALVFWVVWLLHRHWPQSDTASAKEQAYMLIRAYRAGRESIPPDEALQAMEAQLAAFKQRDVMAGQADAMAAYREPVTEMPDTPELIAELGTGLRE